MGKDTSKTVLSNFIWRFAERCGAQGVSFVVSVVLARLLVPEDYGLIALVTVFTSILQVFVDSGLGAALIQKKDADDEDFSTVFYFNIVFCLGLYAILFFCAPFIGAFYEKPELIPVVRVLGLTIVISGVKNIQQAFVSRHMMFKRFFYSTLIGTIVSAVVGIVMAYLGFGVWALVAQGLANNIMNTLILWVTVKWRPIKAFSAAKLKGLFSYGWKLLCSSLLGTIYNDLRQLIIGKMYSSTDLAFYNKGKQLPHLVVTNINTSIDSVLLPAMANEQDDTAKLKSMTRRSIKTSVYVMAPMMIGLAVVAEPLIRLLLTEKWIFSVPYLRVFCISYLFQPIHTANLNAIKALGRSDLFLKLEIVKKVIGLTVLFSTMHWGVLVMAYSMLLTNFLSQIINAWPNKKLLNYGYGEQLRDILPNILTALLMGAGVYAFNFLSLPDLLVLVIQIPVGGILYLLLSKLFKLESFEYVLGTVKGFLHKKRAK